MELMAAAAALAAAAPCRTVAVLARRDEAMDARIEDALTEAAASSDAAIFVVLPRPRPRPVPNHAGAPATFAAAPRVAWREAAAAAAAACCWDRRSALMLSGEGGGAAADGVTGGGWRAASARVVRRGRAEEAGSAATDVTVATAVPESEGAGDGAGAELVAGLGADTERPVFGRLSPPARKTGGGSRQRGESDISRRGRPGVGARRRGAVAARPVGEGVGEGARASGADVGVVSAGEKKGGAVVLAKVAASGASPAARWRQRGTTPAPLPRADPKLTVGTWLAAPVEASPEATGTPAPGPAGAAPGCGGIIAGKGGAAEAARKAGG